MIQQSYSWHISGQNSHSKRYIHPYVDGSPIHNSQDLEATYMFIDRSMDKEDIVQTYSGIVLCTKKIK